MLGGMFWVFFWLVGGFCWVLFFSFSEEMPTLNCCCKKGAVVAAKRAGLTELRPSTARRGASMRCGPGAPPLGAERPAAFVPSAGRDLP